MDNQLKPFDRELLRWLRELPAKWSPIDWDELTQTQSKAILQLVRAGLVELQVSIEMTAVDRPERVSILAHVTGAFVHPLRWKAISAVPSWVSKADGGPKSAVENNCVFDFYEVRLTSEGELVQHEIEQGNTGEALMYSLWKRADPVVNAKSKKVDSTGGGDQSPATACTPGAKNPKAKYFKPPEPVEPIPDHALIQQWADRLGDPLKSGRRLSRINDVDVLIPTAREQKAMSNLGNRFPLVVKGIENAFGYTADKFEQWCEDEFSDDLDGAVLLCEFWETLKSAVRTIEADLTDGNLIENQDANNGEPSVGTPISEKMIEPKPLADDTHAGESANPPSQAKFPKLQKHDRQAWQLSLLSGMTQATIALKLTEEHGKQFTQGQVSRMINRAKKHADASGLSNHLSPVANSPMSVDPKKLEWGKRTDHRTRNQRGRRNPDDD